ncbi:MAG: CHAP domain-containing protein [Novosphingobium sp.]|nr:CHAP domain-containing protein [Novosphingobium sp.]
MTFGLLLASATPALAKSSFDTSANRGGTSSELAPYRQCVPYAREVSGIQIYGDAHSWWKQAEGRYKRGNRPKPGAVMAFRPHGSMRLGHVAAVSRVLDSRTVLLRHANWSPIRGKRGQVERDVKAIDVSPANDWSKVRVWFDPLNGLGKTQWPLHGFIYNEGPGNMKSKPRTRIAKASPAPARRSTDPIADIISGRYR